jgi:hypothetical protein
MMKREWTARPEMQWAGALGPRLTEAPRRHPGVRLARAAGVLTVNGWEVDFVVSVIKEAISVVAGAMLGPIVLSDPRAHAEGESPTRYPAHRKRC